MFSCKKITSLLLAGVLTFSSAIPLSAQDSEADNLRNYSISEDETYEAEVYVVKSEGAYIRAAQDDPNAIAAAANDTHGGTYLLPDGTYLSKTDTEVFQTVKKLSFKLYDEEGLNKVLENNDISQKTKDELQLEHEKAVAAENYETAVELYIPYTLPNTRSISTRTYTYKGLQMKEELVYYFDYWSEPTEIMEGFGTEGIAASISEIAISELNVFVSWGTTILDLFTQAVEDLTITGSANDYLWVEVCYDIYRKNTFVNDPYFGGWVAGAYTERAYLKEMLTNQYYFTSEGGKKVLSTVTFEEDFRTDHYDSPSEIAYRFRGYGYDESLTY